MGQLCDSKRYKIVRLLVTNNDNDNNNNNNNNNNNKVYENFIHRIKKIDYLQIQEYEILKYIPYVHSSCVRKRIVVK